MCLHWVTADLEQTCAENFQPIIWYIWFSSFFLQAQVVRRLAAKISSYFKVVVKLSTACSCSTREHCASMVSFKLHPCWGMGHLSCDCASPESLAAEKGCSEERGSCLLMFRTVAQVIIKQVSEDLEFQVGEEVADEIKGFGWGCDFQN